MFYNPQPPKHYRLDDNEIDLWLLDVTEVRIKKETLLHVLCQEERARYQQFSVAGAGNSFAISRVFLRILLGHYLSASPQSIKFTYGKNGKPILASGSNLEFSVAHSKQFTLYAFTGTSRVGIDIEENKERKGLNHLTAFAFADRIEAESTIPDCQLEWFYRLWTRQEALAKACGCGVAGLDPETIDCLAQGPRTHCCCDGSTWTIHDIASPPGYSAALCHEDTSQIISGYRMQPDCYVRSE